MMVSRLSIACVVLCVLAAAGAADDGVLPVGTDGKPLNLDFETGTLKDWTAEGEAFVGQPVKGDTVFSRRGDMKSQHQGQFWVGSYELKQDKPQGTLTSVPFKVTHPWASFLVGGGAYAETSVEVVRKDTGELILRAPGFEKENLERVAVDLTKHQGKEIFVRVVDKHSGGWGHVNFDDFRFHAEKPNVPPRAAALTPDVYKNAGLTPEKAAAAMTVPEGFEVKLFAGEPDVHQPIALCLDDRGRVWVAEAYAYPIKVPAKEAKDRIVIFEDTDGDGRHDKRTVFMEGLNLVSGLEVGFGGVWVGAAPELLFIPDKDGDDKPDGKPEVLLDGWGYEDTHETLNSFIWGPDGWLYGCHGVFTKSNVGKPGDPDAKRQKINAGVWRYHPRKHVFEVFAHGTSNPWGLDFNDRGQAFVEACVIPHCFHIIQGARYQRQAGSHFNPHTYADIQTIADHRHYLGANPHGGNEKSDSAGGGHAHCGTMIYLGGSWPAEYRDQMFMGNIHGRRLNVDILNPKGSGYVASHGKDFLLANDAWARFINFRSGPDGNAYIIDWYDKQACHLVQPQIWDRTNGRVYKVSHRSTKPVVNVDLKKLTDKELVELQLHANDWYVRHARRVLQERAAAGKLDRETLDTLAKTAFENKDETRRLRGLWALHATGGLTEEAVLKAMADTSPYVRGWAIQLALEGGKASESLLKTMTRLAENDPSPVVRLYLASGLQRLPAESRWAIWRQLIGHNEDATDHNLPLMYWYAAEPLADVNANRALHTASHAEVPNVLSFMARRVASAATPESLAEVVGRLTSTDDVAKQKLILQGMNEALKGRRQVAMPKGWADLYARLSASTDAEVRTLSRTTAVTFGDARAMDQYRQVLADGKADVEARKAALASLLGAGDKQLPPVLRKLLDEPPLRAVAIRALASFDDAETPKAVLAVYASLSTEEKRDALNTLASRAAYGKALLEAIASKKVAANEVPAEIVRQLRSLGDNELTARIGEVWGALRDTPEERKKLIAEVRTKLTKAGAKGDTSHGRAIFAKTCAQCHTLFGVGAKTAPDITGANRGDLNYLLENVLDPGAVIPNEYKVTLLTLTSGRVVTGIVKSETPAALTVVTANETLTIPAGDVDDRKPSSNSLMPDDLLKTLKDDEVRALFAYLQSPAQVPIMATADSVKDFFNGKDLAGWDGDPNLWGVENGEIVGKSPGLKKNEFLRSQMLAGDFKLTLKVKLVPNAENSGIQFRSEPLPGGEMRGPQADVGAGWWGKLYEEHGRGLLWDKSGEQHVRKDDWNDYEVVAQGSKVKTFINGKPCVDLDDAMLARRGVFALQLHSGGPLEVRFKDLKLEPLP